MYESEVTTVSAARELAKLCRVGLRGLRQGTCPVKQNTLCSYPVLQARGEKRAECKKFAGIGVVCKPTEEHWLPLMSTISLTREKELGFASSAQCCLRLQMPQGQTPGRPKPLLWVVQKVQGKDTHE